MMQHTKKTRHFFLASTALFLLFLLYTVALQRLDVQPIGPRGSLVGFASLNGAVHRLLGVHMALYAITDWASLAVALVALGFAVLGLAQWIRRKSLWRVDHSLLVLGGFYLLLATYLFFENHVVNYRPVLIENVLEASYPSSTTMLVLCIMPTAMLQFRQRICHRGTRLAGNTLAGIFIFAMVAGRLLSGVHWLSDIVGGVLLSAALVTGYHAMERWVAGWASRTPGKIVK